MKAKSKLTTTAILCLVMILLFVYFKNEVIEIYSIPSGSMENTLLPGDVVVVKKLADNPLFSKKLCIESGSIVVFRRFQKLYVIKRCTATAGDKLSIKKGEIYLNGKKQSFSEKIKNRFVLFLENKTLFTNLIDSLERQRSPIEYHFNPDYLISDFTFTEIEKLKASYKIKILRVTDPFNSNSELYFSNASNHWTLDDMGPITIPYKNLVIKLNLENYNIYQKTIKEFEGVDLKYINGKYYCGDKEVNSYRFNNNYYFVMGDNRKQSEDSRYIGFIPEENIVGRAAFVFFSIHNGSFQWSRFLKKI